MEVLSNPNRHIVEGKRTQAGIFITPCPHAVGFEYINGWAMRMVGSVTCAACKWNASHQRCKITHGSISVICLHEKGEEPGKEKLSIFKNVKQ